MQVGQDLTVKFAGYHFLIWVDADKLRMVESVGDWGFWKAVRYIITLTSLIRVHVVMERYHFHPRAFL
jgi:hypothetical protein